MTRTEVKPQLKSENQEQSRAKNHFRFGRRANHCAHLAAQGHFGHGPAHGLRQRDARPAHTPTAAHREKHADVPADGLAGRSRAGRRVSTAKLATNGLERLGHRYEIIRAGFEFGMPCQITFPIRIVLPSPIFLWFTLFISPQAILGTRWLCDRVFR